MTEENQKVLDLIVNQKIKRMNERALQQIGGRLRISSNGVPHIIRTIGGITYSYCYFKKTKLWKLFWPWPSFDGQQKRVFKELTPLVKYMNKVKESANVQ